MSTIDDVTTETFDVKVLQSSAPVVVDFWADWCAPCRALTPTVDELSSEYGGAVNFVKVNFDDNPELARRHDVQSIPQLLMFVGGTERGASSTTIRNVTSGADWTSFSARKPPWARRCRMRRSTSRG